MIIKKKEGMMELDFLFERTVDSFSQEVQNLYDKKSYMPCLMLLYSFIDILSWLRYEKISIVRSRFEKFLNKYFKPETNPGCTATDLYGARCGILHSYSADSDLLSKGANKVFYYTGKKPEQDNTNEIHIDFEKLIDVFHRSIRELKKQMKKDVLLEISVTDRSRNWLLPSPE